MALFQSSVIQKELQNLNQTVIDEKWNEFIAHFGNVEIQQKIRGLKEEQYQGEFLDDLFVKVLGYTKPPKPNHNLVTEQKNETNSKKADGAIIVDEKVIGVIELKGTNTTDLEKVKEQAFLYKVSHPECIYVITSNFEKLRFYIENTVDFIEFNLFQLTKKEFSLLYICLSYENIKNNVPKHLKDESVSKESKITKQLYKDYSDFKQALFNNLVELNPQYDKLLLFKKTQKLLDRFLFIFFAEDRQLVPTNLIRRINLEWEDIVKVKRLNVSLYDRYKTYFHDLNAGATVTLPAFGKKTGDAITAQFEIFAYNGGLFMPDEVLDNVKIDDALLHKHTILLSDYDFESDVDVNILGHIFENSLNEIDEIKSEIEGQVIDKTKTKRKKDGVFYTPKYITKYIVDNTVGKLCTEKKNELKLIEEEYHSEKNLQTKTKKALLDKLTEYRYWLLNITICDPACGSGAFLNQALEFLIAEHRYIDELQAKLMGDSMILSDVEASILENNLFGVDLNDESVEIAKLSLWLRTAQRGRKLTSLNNNIKCGNSLIDDPEVAGDKAFSWEKEFPSVFEKGGFDVVIGNPPYVQLQSMGSVSSDLEKMKFESYEKTGDLYCLFYELGNIVLKEDGLLGYITSNKWLRANYGKSLRNYLIDKTQPVELIDLGSGIFESATVDSNILIFEKTTKSTKEFIGLDISKEKTFVDFTVYEERKVYLNIVKNNIWTISSNTEQNIKDKIINVGIPLKNWGIEIKYGIKTGLNEAFIIDEYTRSKLILDDPKSEEIIFPILRGRDLRRYKTDYQGLYLINVHNGYGSSPRIDINNYKAIKEHLDKFYDLLEKRGDKGVTPYNLRNCAYIDDFFYENIFYPDICQRLSFVKVNSMFSNNTGYYLKTNDNYLLAVLNSRLINYYYISISAQLGETGVRSFTIYIENIPIPKISQSLKEPFIEKADAMLQLNKDLQEQIQKFISLLKSDFKFEKPSKKIEDFYLLDWSDFNKELQKNKIVLVGEIRDDWHDRFERYKKQALELKSQIDQTDKEIDRLVYELYGLTEEEIQIIENS